MGKVKGKLWFCKDEPNKVIVEMPMMASVEDLKELDIEREGLGQLLTGWFPMTEESIGYLYEKEQKGQNNEKLHDEERTEQ